MVQLADALLWIGTALGGFAWWFVRPRSRADFAMVLANRAAVAAGVLVLTLVVATSVVLDDRLLVMSAVCLGVLAAAAYDWYFPRATGLGLHQAS